MENHDTRSNNYVRLIHDRVMSEYPSTVTFLNYRNAFELLIAVILSARTTDQSVNEVTPTLFGKFPTPESLASAELSMLEQIVHKTGFYRSKARNIRATARQIAESHRGLVPSDMDALTALPGVGRKTAHVIRGTLFGLPSIIVDTHFGRVSRRLGLTAETDPLKVERDLEQIIPPEMSHSMSMRLNKHGRVYCTSRKPRCEACPLSDVCPKVGVEDP